MYVAEKVLLFLLISLTDDMAFLTVDTKSNGDDDFTTQMEVGLKRYSGMMIWR